MQTVALQYWNLVYVVFVYVLIAARKEEEEPMYKPDLPMTSPQVYAPRKPDIT